MVKNINIFSPRARSSLNMNGSKFIPSICSDGLASFLVEDNTRLLQLIL